MQYMSTNENANKAVSISCWERSPLSHLVNIDLLSASQCFCYRGLQDYLIFLADQ